MNTTHTIVIDERTVTFESSTYTSNKTAQELYENKHLELFFFNGIPVLYHDQIAPQYPRVEIDGVDISNIRHINIHNYFQCTTHNQDAVTYSDLKGVLTLIDGVVSGYQSARELMSIEENITVKFEDLNETLLKMKEQLYSSLTNDLDLEPQRDKESKKQALLEKALENIPDTLDRSDYEKWCQNFNITPINSDCVYGYKNYDYRAGRFGHLPLEEQIGVKLMMKHGKYNYLKQKEFEKNNPIITSIPQPNGQLWQPCECGNEPVYLPLEVCEKCWPK